MFFQNIINVVCHFFFLKVMFNVFHSYGYHCTFKVHQWLKMMSDASDMLAAALEQMDGIIAGKNDQRLF